jgi:hypothetical protein
MKKYLIRFTTTDGDYDKEWCYAISKDDAVQTIKNDHWNIASIDMVSEL